MKLVAQTAPAQPLQSPTNLPTEWGLYGVLAVMAAKSLWQWIHKKEDQESALIQTLVNGLQQSQSELLKQLAETQTANTKALTEVKEALIRLGDEIRHESTITAQRQDQAIAQLNNRLNQFQRKEESDS